MELIIETNQNITQTACDMRTCFINTRSGDVFGLLPFCSSRPYKESAVHRIKQKNPQVHNLIERQRSTDGQTTRQRITNTLEPTIRDRSLHTEKQTDRLPQWQLPGQLHCRYIWLSYLPSLHEHRCHSHIEIPQKRNTRFLWLQNFGKQPRCAHYCLFSNLAEVFSIRLLIYADVAQLLRLKNNCESQCNTKPIYFQ